MTSVLVLIVAYIALVIVLGLFVGGAASLGDEWDNEWETDR